MADARFQLLYQIEIRIARCCQVKGSTSTFISKPTALFFYPLDDSPAETKVSGVRTYVEGGLVKNPLLFYLDPSNSHNGNLSPWCWNVKEKQEKRQAIKSRRTYIAIIMLTAINFVVIECLMAVDVSDNANWLQ